MSVNQTHPEYDAHKNEWMLVRDAYIGERRVKERGTFYLPKPNGFNAAKDGGVAQFNAYRMRAQFPDIFAPAVRGITGIVHGTEWTIELPSALEPLREEATPDGQTLETLARRVTSEILTSGRVGLLTDAPPIGGDPFISVYGELSIINWDSGLFVLDESGYVRDGFQWTWQESWRVLELQDGRYIQRVFSGPNNPGEELQPSISGGGSLDEIPFIIAGPKDLTPEIDKAPLIGIARAALAYYRLDADYRHQLFNSGQETLFIINGDAPDYIGAGVVHEMKTDSTDVTPDAKYVGPSGKTIEAHKNARMDELERAAEAGAQMFMQDGGAGESGEARRLRQNSELANIKTIAGSSAAALEKSLKSAAKIAGANENEVAVRPPAKMLEPMMTGQEALNYVKGWKEGGYSFPALFDILQRGQLHPAELTADEELRRLDAGEFPPDDET